MYELHVDEAIYYFLYYQILQTSAFYDALTESGIKLGEPQPIPHTFEVDPELTYDSYEMQHTREDNTE